MAGFLAEAYPLVRALHIIAVIAWMAGLLYLPRLYVYHADTEPGSRQSETFKAMEHRLLRAILNPAMITTWAFGLALVAHLDAWGAPWMHAKFALVIALSALHGALARWRSQFAADANRHGARFYRIVNEVPTGLMVGVVLLVVLKPF